MKGFLMLGVGAFLTGAAVAVAVDRRSGLDEDFGEDTSWPAVPYTAATHPGSPQEQVATSSTPPPEAPQPGAVSEPASARAENGSSAQPPAET